MYYKITKHFKMIPKMDENMENEPLDFGFSPPILTANELNEPLYNAVQTVNSIARALKALQQITDPMYYEFSIDYYKEKREKQRAQKHIALYWHNKIIELFIEASKLKTLLTPEMERVLGLSITDISDILHDKEIEYEIGTFRSSL